MSSKIKAANNDLVARLAAELQPVPQQAAMPMRIGAWLVWVWVAVALLAVMKGRPDLDGRLMQMDFQIQLGLWLAVMVTAGISAFAMATPRWPMAQKIIAGICVSLAGVLGFALWLAIKMPSAATTGRFDMACVVIVSVVGVLSALTMVWALKARARSTYPALMALMAGVACGAAGMLAITFVCPNESAGHVLVSHFAPALLIGLMLTLIGKRWWRW